MVEKSADPSFEVSVGRCCEFEGVIVGCVIPIHLVYFAHAVYHALF